MRSEIFDTSPIDQEKARAIALELLTYTAENVKRELGRVEFRSDGAFTMLLDSSGRENVDRGNYLEVRILVAVRERQ